MGLQAKHLLSKGLGRWRVIVVIAAGLLTMAATVYALWQYRFVLSKSTPNPLPQAITIRPVTALGRLEPQGEAIHASTIASPEGTRILQILVKEGEKVKAGQVLAILDTRDRRLAALREAEKQVDVAKARLAQIKAGAKTGEINAQQKAILRTEAELRGNIAAQTAIIARQEAEVKNAESEYNRYSQLYQQGAVSASTLDAKRLTLETTQEQLQESRATLTRIRESVAAQLQEARANLNRIAEVRPTDVQAAQAEIERTIAVVARSKADLDLAYVRAPKAGRIMKLHVRPGEVVSNQGEGILKLGQTDQMYIVAEVYETDIGKIRLGQQAIATADAFTGTLKGTVDQLGWEIGKKDVLNTDPAAATDARVVEVKIRLDPSSSQRVASLTNLQVTVEIQL